MARHKYKTRTLPQITVSGQIVDQEFKIDDSNAEMITAISLVTDRPDLLPRGRVRIEINSDEIFDDQTFADFLKKGDGGVLPNGRMFSRMGEIAYGNGIMKVRYTDENVGTVAFAPYRVSVFLEYRVKENAL